eukprot:5745031-Prorocentrum_lima.AAC.1
MTSSLVGSEMCIRDRPSPSPPSPPSLPSPVISHRRRQRRQRRQRRPVSYTHLTLPTICSV